MPDEMTSASTKGSGLDQGRWALTAAVLLAWSVPAALNAAMEFLVDHRTGRAVDLSAMIIATAVPWYVWAAFTPTIKRLVRARPLSWPPSVAAVALHSMLYAVATTVFVLIIRIFRLALGLPVAPGGVWASAIGWAPFTLLAYAAAAGIAHAAFFAMRARDEAVSRAVLAEELTRSQLDALRMQLHPHFLFNALNTISMLVRDHDAPTAVRLIAELGDILREMLREHRTPEIPLAHEIDLVRRYLAVEQVRFGDRLEVQWRIEPQLLSASVPPFILQPIVENAIRHGISRRTEAGEIRIEAVARGDALVLSVLDDGPDGPPNGALTPVREGTGGGLGLVTTRARLDHLYGSRAYIRLSRTEGRFTLVTIVLPLSVPDVVTGGDGEVPTHASAESHSPVAASAVSAP